MKLLVTLMLITPLINVLIGEEITIQKIETTDGRILIGQYDDQSNMLTLIDEKTLKTMVVMMLDPSLIKSRSDIKVEKKAIDPLDKRGINGKWITNYENALKLSNETHRPILALLTGSDWCPWCMKLEKEMTAQQKFKDWAKGNVVLLYLDYPQKFKLPKDLVKQNAELQAKWGTNGYPTILFINDKGEKYDWKFGYSEDGFDKWLEWIEFSMKKLIKK